jgi:hypothetical protein
MGYSLCMGTNNGATVCQTYFPDRFYKNGKAHTRCLICGKEVIARGVGMNSHIVKHVREAERRKAAK